MTDVEAEIEVVTGRESEEVDRHEKRLSERKVSLKRLRRADSLILEAGKICANPNHASMVNWRTTLSLAFQSIGVVYGDIGTSPLYVYSSIFPGGIHHENDIIGALSLIIYTLTLIPLLKYVFIVLRANDNGEGGTFALYSLICRYAKIGLIPNQEPEDREVSNYSLELPSKQLKSAHKIKEKLENAKAIHILLFLVAIMGTSMVIGDGVLTPSISVLSAVGGIKSLGQDADMWISVIILIILFSVQRFGTDKVGCSFAPILLLWFLFNGGIGVYNLFKHDIGVLRAFNPLYIIDYFRRNGKMGWVSLGGVILCITGTEAMFADLGHFSIQAIQISFPGIVYPALLIVYCGQTAYLSKHPEDVSNTFYASVPGPMYWPMFAVAIAASIIASQAMISGTFSIVSQSQRLCCFPSVKVVHTSTKYEGQVYIPEVNYLLMLACVLLTIIFRTTEKIGNAYGIAVVSLMVITTSMVSLIMLIIWKISIWWIALFLFVFGSVEMVYLSSVMFKFTNGGFLPLGLAIFLMSIMGIWHYVHVLKYRYELDNKVSEEFTRQLAQNPNISRVPGIAFLYSELVQGISPLFSHYISNISSVHSLFVLVSIKRTPIRRVVLEDRFLFRHVEPKDFRMFRCVVRYGYKDDIEEPQELERQLLHYLKEYICRENSMDEEKVDNMSYETEFIDRARERGVVYLMGETDIVAENRSSLFKKFVINYAYNFLKKNCRQGDKALAIPRSKLLKVGMTYEL